MMKLTNTKFKLTFLVLIFLTISSCLKKQNLEESNLGPSIDAATVEKVMSDGFGDFNLNDLNVNEYSSTTNTATYEDSQTIKVSTKSITYKNTTYTASETTLSFIYSKVDHINSQNSFSNLQYDLKFARTALQQSSYKLTDLNSSQLQIKNEILTQSVDSPFFLFLAYAQFTFDECKTPNVSCYNFVSQDYTIKLAEPLADSRICADTTNCIIPAKTIEFDTVDHNIIQSDGKPTRTHYKFMVSNALPFLSRVLKFCARGLVDYDSRKVLLEQCYIVNNFTVGD